MPIETLNIVIGNLVENRENKLTNRFDSLLSKCLNTRVWVGEQQRKRINVMNLGSWKGKNMNL